MERPGVSSRCSACEWISPVLREGSRCPGVSARPDVRADPLLFGNGGRLPISAPLTSGTSNLDAARPPGARCCSSPATPRTPCFSYGHLEPGMQVRTKPFAMEALAGRIKELIIAR